MVEVGTGVPNDKEDEEIFISDSEDDVQVVYNNIAPKIVVNIEIIDSDDDPLETLGSCKNKGSNKRTLKTVENIEISDSENDIEVMELRTGVEKGDKLLSELTQNPSKRLRTFHHSLVRDVQEFRKDDSPTLEEKGVEEKGDKVCREQKLSQSKRPVIDGPSIEKTEQEIRNGDPSTLEKISAVEKADKILSELEKTSSKRPKNQKHPSIEKAVKEIMNGGSPTLEKSSVEEKGTKMCCELKQSPSKSRKNVGQVTERGVQEINKKKSSVDEKGTKMCCELKQSPSKSRRNVGQLTERGVQEIKKEKSSVEEKGTKMCCELKQSLSKSRTNVGQLTERGVQKIKKEECSTEEKNDKTSNEMKQSPSKSSRNVEHTIERAVQEIRKGGSLALISHYYGIPMNVLFEKLVSKSLPDVSTLLTRNEEEDLIKWILRSYRCNNLIFKNQLMERVGKLKKISKITPIFHKSKYGRLWYYNFLSAHPEIYESDGVLLKCDTFESYRDKRRSVEKLNDETDEVHIVDDKSAGKVVPVLNVKDAVVVLHDIKKIPSLSHHPQVSPIQPENGLSTQNLDNNSNNRNIKLESDTSTCKTEEDDNFGMQNGESLSNNMDQRNKTCKRSNNHLYKKYRQKRLQTQFRPECKMCNISFSNSRNLRRHMSNIHQNCPVNCFKCKKQFSSLDRLKVHERLMHSTTRFGCDECQKVFKHKTSLRHHKQHHAGKKQCAGKKQSAGNFICDMCLKSFSYKSSLEHHIRFGHMKEKMTFKCKMCNKYFIKHSQLLRHKISHSKTFIFFCCHCNKGFSRKYLLTNHLEVCTMYKEIQIEMECEKISKEYLEGIVLD